MILYKYLKPIVLFLFLFCFNALIVFAEPIDCPKNSEIQQLKEKIIRLEAIQETDTNSLTLFSILISAVIAGSILISGGFVYFSNKRALAEYKIKQDKIDSLNNSLLETQDRQDARLKDMENLSNNFTNELKLHDQNLNKVAKILKIFVKFSVNQVEVLNHIAEEYQDLHFEIFDNLNFILFNFYDNKIIKLNIAQEIELLSNIILMIAVAHNKSNEIKDFKIPLENTTKELDRKIQELSTEVIDDDNKNETIKTATHNLKKALKSANGIAQEQVEQINKSIEILQRV